MTLCEQIRTFVSLGYKFEFSHEPMNLNIKISWRGNEKVSWLPTNDHCDEKTIVRYVAYMIDQIQQEQA